MLTMTDDKVDIKYQIELLLLYAEKHNLVNELDIILSRNKLLYLFELDAPYIGDIKLDDSLTIDEILSTMLQYVKKQDLTSQDLFEGVIMQSLTPSQWQVEYNFSKISKEKGTENACEYFYNLSKATNYIKTQRIAKNLYWEHNNGLYLQITINLSKPEKSPEEIAAASQELQSSYPVCLLCIENIGHAGCVNKPPRQVHRVIPITLGGQQWYLQYSPYSYYNEHCIPFCGQHVPICINSDTFKKLFDFIEIFPHYFVGSNADLPIVGASMLSHDHFQAGRHSFPIENAPSIASFSLGLVTADILDWPLSTVRLKSKSKDEIISMATNILYCWKKYQNNSLDILAFTDGTAHNTITPIARVNKNGIYELDLVLRNNRTTDKYPDGIFHSHRDVQHIKRENIGLIEVMGLAILPGRLASEIEYIADYLLKKPNVPQTELQSHMTWIKELQSLHSFKDKCQTLEILKLGIGDKFKQALQHAGVFKLNKQGINQFESFLSSCGLNKASR